MASFPLDTSTETGVTSAGGFLSLPRHVISQAREPKDLGRLRAVCKGLRDAVDLTGRKIKKLSDVLAAEGGYLSLLKDNTPEAFSSRVCCSGEKRRPEELKALRAVTPWNEYTCAYARRVATSRTLKWARDNGCGWNDETCAEAAEHGHLEVLKWARANGAGSYVLARREAAATSRCFSGRARTTARGTSTRARTQRRAATSRCSNGRARTAARGTSTRAGAQRKGGHLVLKWACFNGCPWDERHVRVRGEGRPPRGAEGARATCPWNEKTCAYAAGRPRVLKWARANGAGKRANARRRAAPLLREARANGCRWNDVRVRGGGRPPRDMKWAGARELPVERGDVTPPRPPRGAQVGAKNARGTCILVLERRHAQVLKWIATRRTCGIAINRVKRVTSKPEPTRLFEPSLSEGRRFHDEARKRGAWKSFEKLVTVAKKKIENIWVISHNIQN